MFGDNWAEVAEHVGTKSSVQCILHFLQLPIEDQFIEELEQGGPQGGPGTKGVPEVVSEEEAIPFMDSSNPIMAQVACLAMMVGPRVAAAAAKGALAVMSADDPAAAYQLHQLISPGGVGSRPPPPTGAEVEVEPSTTQGGSEETKGGLGPGMDLDMKKEGGPGAGPVGWAAGRSYKTRPAERMEAFSMRTVVPPPSEIQISAVRVRTAAAAALGAAAAQAQVLADLEGEEVMRLVMQVVDVQARKIALKLKHAEELDKALESERATLEASRKALDAERIRLRDLSTLQHASLSRNPFFTMLRANVSTRASIVSRRSCVRVQAAAWTKVATSSELAAAGGKKVVEVGGQKVLLASVDGSVYAVSNKCTHLGLPLVGKTAMFQGEIADKCIVCPTHKTAFDLATGEVKGEWCPGFPDLPLVGKVVKTKPLPTFESRVSEAGEIEINI
eukprot:gene3678-13753_t